jgi:hypothetical protein
METETKTHHPLLITTLIVIALAALGLYYWNTRNSAGFGDSNTPPKPAPVVTKAEETTPEQDLSSDVLTGTDFDLGSGVK